MLASACADLVGPSQWNVREHDSPYREDAKLVLDYLYQVRVVCVSGEGRLEAGFVSAISTISSPVGNGSLKYNAFDLCSTA